MCIINNLFRFWNRIIIWIRTFQSRNTKKIFFEIQNYLNNNNDIENIEEIKVYIDYKFNYWILKLQNQNFISLNKEKDSILGEKEVKERIEKLCNYINIEKNIYKKKKKNEKTFILKIIYELALYYYYKNLIENSNKYLELLIQYYTDYIEEYKINITSKENKLFYFWYRKS